MKNMKFDESKGLGGGGNQRIRESIETSMCGKYAGFSYNDLPITF